MNLNPDYYKSREYHTCMVCNTPIAKLVNNRLQALDNKAHVLLEKTKPGLYSINMCRGCGEQLDLTDQDLLDDLHANVVESKELLLQRQGVSQDIIDQQKITWNADKPLVGWNAVETNPRQRDRLISQYKSYLENKS